jgi:hypothetical protein
LADGGIWFRFELVAKTQYKTKEKVFEFGFTRGEVNKGEP